MKALNSLKYWEELLNQSEERPIIVFKHSNSCPVSLDAFERVKTLEEESLEDDMYLLIVQHYREISDKIEEDLNLKHESPQVIVVFKKEPVYSETHEAIDPAKLLREYKKHL